MATAPHGGKGRRRYRLAAGARLLRASRRTMPRRTMPRRAVIGSCRAVALPRPGPRLWGPRSNAAHTPCGGASRLPSRFSLGSALGSARQAHPVAPAFGRNPCIRHPPRKRDGIMPVALSILWRFRSAPDPPIGRNPRCGHPAPSPRRHPSAPRGRGARSERALVLHPFRAARALPMPCGEGHTHAVRRDRYPVRRQTCQHRSGRAAQRTRGCRESDGDAY